MTSIVGSRKGLRKVYRSNKNAELVELANKNRIRKMCRIFLIIFQNYNNKPNFQEQSKVIKHEFRFKIPQLKVLSTIEVLFNENLYENQQKFINLNTISHHLISKSMSKNYSTSNQSFFQNESRIRKLIQTELQQFFSCIKDEIQNKIKSMDRSISTIKLQIKNVVQRQNQCFQMINQSVGKEKLVDNKQSNISCECQKKWEENNTNLKDISEKIAVLQKQRNRDVSRIWEQLRSRGGQRRQQKSPLFRKTNGNALDLNDIIFGEQNLKSNINAGKIKEKPQQLKIQSSVPTPKPPLPKQRNEGGQQRSYRGVRNPQKGLVPSALADQLSHEEQKMQRAQPLNLREGQNKQKIESIPANKGIISMEIIKTGDLEQTSAGEIASEVRENLNKNKNSFMRKKSLKKFSTIIEEDVEQSMMSTR